MVGIGINEKELRRVEALARVKRKELKVVDAASLLGPLRQVPRNASVLSEARFPRRVQW